MTLEEAALYPAMKPVTGAETFDEANKEHELASTGLEQMVELAPDEPGFDGALAAVKAGSVTTSRKKKGEIFPTRRFVGWNRTSRPR